MRAGSPSLSRPKKKGPSGGGASSSSRNHSPSMHGPSSPCADDSNHTGKQSKKSAGASPSMLGLSPIQGPESGEPLPPLDLPPALVEAEVYQGKVPVPAPVPPSPPDFNSSSIASETTGIGLDEMYSKDEKLLNQFLKLHPMLSNGMLHSQYIRTLVWHCESGCGLYADQYFVPPFLYWQKQPVSALYKLLQACSRRQA